MKYERILNNDGNRLVTNRSGLLTRVEIIPKYAECMETTSLMVYRARFLKIHISSEATAVEHFGIA